jgi:hypothetical protein
MGAHRQVWVLGWASWKQSEAMDRSPRNYTTAHALK